MVTKVDTMEEGSDWVDVLSGKVYPLRRGYEYDRHLNKQVLPMVPANQQHAFFASEILTALVEFIVPYVR